MVKKTRKKKANDLFKSLAQRENAFSIAAALLVIFSAMIDPIISFALASAMIMIFILYKMVSQDS